MQNSKRQKLRWEQKTKQQRSLCWEEGTRLAGERPGQGEQSGQRAREELQAAKDAGGEAQEAEEKVGVLKFLHETNYFALV